MCSNLWCFPNSLRSASVTVYTIYIYKFINFLHLKWAVYNCNWVMDHFHISSDFRSGNHHSCVNFYSGEWKLQYNFCFPICTIAKERKRLITVVRREENVNFPSAVVLETLTRQCSKLDTKISIISTVNDSSRTILSKHLLCAQLKKKTPSWLEQYESEYCPKYSFKRLSKVAKNDYIKAALEPAQFTCQTNKASAGFIFSDWPQDPKDMPVKQAC